MIKYKEYYPGDALAPYIKCFWSYEHDLGGISVSELSFPKGFLNLVFVKEGYFNVDMGNSKKVHIKHSILAPHLSSPAWFEYSPSFSIVGVSIYPWANRKILKNPLYHFTDEFITPDEIYGKCGRELCQYVRENDMSCTLEYLRKFFKRLVEEGDLDYQMRYAITEIASLQGSIEMDSLTQNLRITPRRIQQRFFETLGYGPKYFARIVRFKRLISKIPLESSLTQLSYEMDYADQSHMIKEFRHFTGFSPARFISYLCSSTHLMRTVQSEIKRDSC